MLFECFKNSKCLRKLSSYYSHSNKEIASNSNFLLGKRFVGNDSLWKFIWVTNKKAKNKHIETIPSINNKTPSRSSYQALRNAWISKPTKTEQDIDYVAKKAAFQLLNGKVIVVPTDTVYGVACLAYNQKAVSDIYEIKGRQNHKPISMCVADIDDVYQLAHVTIPVEVLNELLPGPVTLCFVKKEMHAAFNLNTPLVGVRIPDHPLILKICQTLKILKLGCAPMALTSANLSGKNSCLRFEELKQLFIPKAGKNLSMVIDGGSLVQSSTSRAGSTVVDLSIMGYYKILREGCALEHTVEILKKYDITKICT